MTIKIIQKMVDSISVYKYSAFSFPFGGYNIELMSKKSENNITERILKSKYLDKDKQKTVPLINPSNKSITLIHLCPQQKLKIGQLIKTLQQRKIENQQLTEKIDRLSMHFNDSQEQLNEMTLLCEEKERTISALDKRIAQMQQQLHKIHSKNKQITHKMKEYSHKHKKHSIGIQTQQKLLSHKSTATILQTVQISMQTLQQQQKGRDLFYRPHSKSFQKIMRNTNTLNIQPLQTRPFQQNNSPSSNSNGKHKITSIYAKEEEESVEELNKKWSKLKFKHQQQTSKQIQSPHSFNVSSQKDSGSKLNQIDEIMLNRMLRLKDFSASKLIQLKKQQLSSSSQREEDSPSVNYLKSPYFNSYQPESTLNPKKNKNIAKNTLIDSEQQINFYQSDLFDPKE